MIGSSGRTRRPRNGPLTLEALARVLLGSIFIHGGVFVLLRPDQPTGRLNALMRRVGQPDRPALSKALVQTNATAMVVGGVALAAGVAPRTSAYALGALLQLTNVVGHAFWAESDPAQRFAHRTGFVSNLAITGGLLLVRNRRQGAAG